MVRADGLNIVETFRTMAMSRLFVDALRTITMSREHMYGLSKEHMSGLSKEHMSGLSTDHMSGIST